MKKILLITSGQPSLNPRIVKEADALVEAGYNVKVIYQYWNDWGAELDATLLEKKKWQAVCIGGNKTNNKLIYWFTRIQLKIGKILAKNLGIQYFAEFAIGRCTKQLIRVAKGIKADLYIAHNLGALPAAVNAAKKNKAKSGFDAEDFHRNEVSDNYQDFDVTLKKFIEDKYIPKIDYLSTSSQFITEKYQLLYPTKTPKAILNVFPPEKSLLKKDNKKLKLFWFSQTIGKNRGLEETIIALKNQVNIELHLLGSYNALTKEYFNLIAEQNSYFSGIIFYHDPIASDKIITFASQFDLGIASEIGQPLNRDLCLTNKIFTYIQAGLALIASDTTAQSALLNQYPNMGMVYQKNNAASLASVIKTYVEDRALLLSHQKQAKKYADEILNWEVEKLKFLSIVKETLKS